MKENFGHSETMENNISIQEVTRNRKNRYLFRQLAHESAGEGFECPDDNKLVFAWYNVASKKILVGGACYIPADAALQDKGTVFDSLYYHVITYIFIKGQYKGHRIGTQLVRHIESDMLTKNKRPIRVQASWKAVKFFERSGFVQCGAPIDCICSGSPLFDRLFNMEKCIT